MGSVVKSVGGLFGINSESTTGDKAIGEVGGQLSLRQQEQFDFLKNQAANRNNLAQQLADSAQGKAGSLAQQQLAAQTNRSLAQQLALARSGRGVNPALASRGQQRLGAQLAQGQAVNALEAQRQAQADYNQFLTGQQEYASKLAGAATQATASQSQADANTRKTGNDLGGGLLQGGMSAAAGLFSSDKNYKTKIQKMAQGGLVKKPEYKDSPRLKEDSKKAVIKYGASGLSKDEIDALFPIKMNAGGMVSPEMLMAGAKAFGSARQQQAKQGDQRLVASLISPEDSSYYDLGSNFQLKKKENMMEATPDMMALRSKEMQMDPATMMPQQTMFASQGALVKGPEVVKGDDEANDVVDAKLSAGEMVVPKTVVAKGPDAVRKFADKTLKAEEKKDFSPSKFLDALQAYSFEYKDASKPGASKGRQLGVMAQDLEKSAAGKSIVEDTPNGKMVNTNKGFAAVLAAAADMNKRLKKLEGK